MRNTLPLHFRLQTPAPNATTTATPPSQHHVPTIRFISATPSVVANSPLDASSSYSVAPFASSPLAPKSKNADAPRKRLVPKKSKLGLLSGVGTSSKAKEKGSKDFSDVVRRVGAGNPSSTGRGGFEIYVDQAQDPEIGEIVMVKKQKSRLGLDGMRWGALGETTNVAPIVPAKNKDAKAPVENLLKVKGEDTQKWWSIGRGRKDSKDKSKENAVKEKERDASHTRSRTPEPFQPAENRSRFNSLGSSALLSSQSGTLSSMQTLLVPSGTTTAAPSPTEPIHNLLVPPPIEGAAANGSIAIRAMKSMRSLARMKSWATLAGATSDKESNTNASTTVTITNGKTKDKKEGDGKEKKKKKEKKEKSKTIRISGSSFEAGTLSAQASPMPAKTLGPNCANVGSVSKKQSMLGLGLPSTLRANTNNNTVRQVSSASSSASVPPSSILNGNGRLSVDSAHLIMGANGRPSSTFSSGSSLRPPSTASGVSAFSGRSARSSSSSVVSVRWDEQGIRHAKDQLRQERKSRRESAQGKEKGTDGKSTRHSSEGRQRRLISDIFPEVQTSRSRSVTPPSATTAAKAPFVKVEAATADGHEAPGDEPLDDDDSTHIETPVKRARPRPVSEQLLGKMRPQAIHDSEGGDGVLSILDAATNDLASLINRLDLEATPASSNGTPLRHTPLSATDSPARAVLPHDDSPLKRRNVKDSALIAELRQSVASISSLRPYALSQAQTVKAAPVNRQQAFNPSTLIGQNIAPWSTLDWKVSPRKPTARPVRPKHMTHKRTITPSPANDEPPVVFQPLRPARTRVKAVLVTAASSAAGTPDFGSGAEPSSQTFGSSKPSKIGLQSMSSMGENESPAPSPTPIFKRSNTHIRAGSVFSVMGRKKSSTSSYRSSVLSSSITSETKRVLGMTGTLGGSTEPTVDPEDPDSDIPNELQVILSGQSDEECTQAFDDTISMHRLSAPPSPIVEAEAPLPPAQVLARQSSHPIFRATLIDEGAHLADIDEGNNSSEEDETKKSFDFTGELQKLNESGASDRKSFVEQLENAFRTPARIDLGLDDGFLKVTHPPLPALPLEHRSTPGDDVAPRTVSSGDFTSTVEGDEHPRETHYPIYREPDTLDQLMAECDEDMCMSYPETKKSNGSMRSKASDGQLNTSFRFGGRPSLPELSEEPEERPLTLSDIIPPVGHHSRSHSASSNLLDDSLILKSIVTKATDMPSVRRRANSDSSVQRPAEISQTSHPSSHSRAPSEVSMASFTGFDSFDEVRRGFEFGPDRPAFYPPPGATRPAHNRYESVYSIASVSSYGATLNSGVMDPFGYGPSRPTSEDYSISMSMTVDDTFAYRRQGRRSRVESDASSSSFYFPVNNRRGHRRHESNMSTMSNAPPVSIYNRSFGAHVTHRRNDSNTSVSSVAQNFIMQNRAAWARHRPELSVDSMSTDFSGMRLGRPGLGDRMFEMDHGVPLTAISASPPESLSRSMARDRTEFDQTEFDSIMDNDRRYSVAEDSLFEQTGYRSSYSDDSESVFGYDASHPQINPSRQFRPLSMVSVGSIRPGEAQDDTMVTMIGGGRAPVRRRSVESLMDASPLYRVGVDKKDRKKESLNKVGRVLDFGSLEDKPAPPSKESPAKARLVEKPSIASTSSHQFGGERMIMARKGLLERQSLEDSAIMAQGEDLLASFRTQSVFTRPRPGSGSRSRSSTVTTSSGAETPPLSASDGSSVSGDSQSSIDIAHLSSMLSTFDPPSSGIARARARARARGTGHRRRISQARASRSSVYETIHEESYVLSSSLTASPAPSTRALNTTMKVLSPVVDDSVYVVDSDGQSVSGSIDWTDDKGIVGLRQYYALKGEADETVRESKRTWLDTPFSMFAVQSFEPPFERTAMCAMLEHSQQNYGPLPSELRPHRVRSRTSSRPSPYPTRIHKSVLSPERQRNSVFSEDSHHEYSVSKPFAWPLPVPALQEITTNPNLSFLSTIPVLNVKPFSPFSCDVEEAPQKSSDVNKMGLPVRPRVTSSARRTALGWTKRSSGKASSSEQKENVSQGSIATPGETLRIHRPRPRGRPTPARTSTIRV